MPKVSDRHTDARRRYLAGLPPRDRAFALARLDAFIAPLTALLARVSAPGWHPALPAAGTRDECGRGVIPSGTTLSRRWWSATRGNRHPYSER